MIIARNAESLVAVHTHTHTQVILEELETCKISLNMERLTLKQN